MSGAAGDAPMAAPRAGANGPAATNDPAPLRLLLATTSLMGGGAERQVFLLARGLRARGHAVAVVSMLAPENYVPELKALGIPLSDLGMRRGVTDPRALTRLAGVVRRWRPDVVHSHMVHANLLARLVRLLAPVPVEVSTAHNLTEGARWREIAYRLTDPLCTLTTNVCRACVARYVQVGASPERKIRYLPNGLDLSTFGADDAARGRLRRELGVGDAFVWLAVGRLDVQKDYPTMLRAVAVARDAERPFAVLVAGDGPERGALEAQAEALGLGAGRLHFLGVRRDVPDLMRAADGYLMSSAWEGLPMVLLEAAASGLPAAATAVGGNREVVEPEVNGLLVPPRDPDALAAAMRRVMAMPAAERTAWSDAGRRRVRDSFDIDRIVERWEALYFELRGPRRVRRPPTEASP